MAGCTLGKGDGILGGGRGLPGLDHLMGGDGDLAGDCDVPEEDLAPGDVDLLEDCDPAGDDDLSDGVLALP